MPSGQHGSHLDHLRTGSEMGSDRTADMKRATDGPRVRDSASRMLLSEGKRQPGQRKSWATNSRPPVVGRPVAPLRRLKYGGIAASRGANWASTGTTLCDFGAILETK